MRIDPIPLWAFICPALFLVAAAILLMLPSGAETNTCEVYPEEVANSLDELQVFEQINNYRVASGLHALVVSPLLTQTAAWKAYDMYAHAYIGHIDSLGRDPWQMQSDCGYSFNTWKGENLSPVGISDPLLAWQNSPGHNNLLLSSNFNAAGISTSGGYWALEFGGFVDIISLSPPTPEPIPVTPPPITLAPEQPEPTPTECQVVE